MTSPIQPKPEATNDKYNDIHSVGSSFGQDLKNEAQVRQLLMGEDNGGAVFARAVRNFTQNVAGFVTELFSPEGASYHVITGAVTEQLGPINNAITASGERHLELAAEVDERISEQDRIIERSNTLLDENVAAIDALEKENAGITERVTKAVNDAEMASDAIKSLNTSLNSKIEEQIKASDYLEGELAKADSSVTAVSDLVRLQNPWKWTADWRSGASITQTDTQMFIAEGASTKNYANRALTNTSIPLVSGRTYRIRVLGKGKGRVEIGFYRNKNGAYSSSVWPSGSSKTFDGNLDHYVDWTVDYIKEGENGYVAVLYMRSGEITLDNVTVQDISDLALVQPQINEGFSMALKAHQTLFEGQQNWNTTQEAINKFNSTKWATQTGVDKAQNDALKALSRVDLGGNVVPYLDLEDSEIGRESKQYKPVWAFGTNKEFPAGDRLGDCPDGSRSWGVSSDVGRITFPKIPVKVNRNQQYKVRFWAKAHKDSFISIRLYNQHGNHAIKSGSLCTEADGTLTRNRRNEIAYKLKITPTWTEYETVIEFDEIVDSVYIPHVEWNTPGLDKSTPTSWQALANLRIYPNIPSQDQINQQHSELLRQGVAFDEQQKVINRTTQEQIWNHQDMIELLDIRTPKAAGWLESMSGQAHTYPSYGSTKSNGSPVVPSHPTTNYLYDDSSPFYCVASNMNDMHYVICKGKWVGSFTISVNWDSGVIDEWVMPVTKTNRVFSFVGGASHINMRSTRVELQVTSLARKAVYSSTGSTWGKTDDGDNFARAVNHGEDKLIRMRNTCKCDKAVYYLDAEGKSTAIAAGKVISGVALPARLNTAGAYTFTEVTDEDFSYSFDKSSPQKGQYETITNRSK